jgi:hypothetical protein
VTVTGGADATGVLLLEPPHAATLSAATPAKPTAMSFFMILLSQVR